MRIVLADLKGGEGFISKDTVAGGYGSRLRPFSKMTAVIAGVKRRFHNVTIMPASSWMQLREWSVGR